VRLALAVVVALVGCSSSAEEAGAVRSGAAPCEGVACRLAELSREAERVGAASWELVGTPSFRVLHFARDRALAARLAAAAERTRARQLHRWQGGEPAPWTPRCDVYLYPTTRLMVQLGGGDPKAGSAAAQPSRLYRGRVLSRRLNLAADDAELLDHTLPHEISHIIVSDLVAARVPLWGHEGLAVLEEPAAVQRRYDAALAAALAGGRAFSVKALMEMTRYPDRPHVTLFYAQSLSLARFLRERAGAARLIAFLRDAPGGVEAALSAHYGIDLLALQRAWQESVVTSP
jgi:hypothetical protein